jgi:hypothetical protein
LRSYKNLNDPEKIPGYLSRYKHNITNHARVQMEAHLKRANHLAKLGEKITDMEFVITFTWASILNNRDRVITYARKDGQFFK